MNLLYNEDGNIKAQNYRTAYRTGLYNSTYNTSVQQLYNQTFSYDVQKRLNGAIIKTGTVDKYILGGSTGNITYDDLGNITSLKRTASGVVLDDLTYVYEKASTPIGVDINRRLKSITESSADPNSEYFKAQAGAEYSYTQDGSMKSDGNKNLTLTYNPLGLIAKANTNGVINDYLYSASGQKLSMTSGGKTYTYRGGIVYGSVGTGTSTTDQIEQIATAEGRWLPKEALSSFKPDGTKSVSAKYGRYEFMMKDHLGNNRLAFRCIEMENATAITQAYPAIVTAEYQYDAWGLSIENQMMASTFTAQFGKFAATNRYKYNDKEYISDSKLYDYGARHYDPVVGRWWGVDPLAAKNSFESPYVFVHNSPLIYVDPDGKDGIIIIKGGQISINANVYLYGGGATKEVVKQMQSDIKSRWGGNYTAQTSDGNRKFTVNVNINIDLYEGKEKNDPILIEESWNPFNRDNFVEIGAGDKRSYVKNGDEGEWRSQGRKGLTLAQDDPAPHEVGHLLGLSDRYTDKDGPNKGWESNIMGSSRNGKVEQRNIDGILQDVMKAYETWLKNNINSPKEFIYKYEINTNNPSKENK
jgi:RHS repeat-associated protein